MLSHSQRAEDNILKIGHAQIHVEIAHSLEEKTRGLMHRKVLEENSGMLFVYDEESHPAFWMKNTGIPLSLAFIDSSGAILQIEDLIPLSTERVVSKHSVRFGLEVNQGWFDINNIHVGDKVIFPESLIRSFSNNE